MKAGEPFAVLPCRGAWLAATAAVAATYVYFLIFAEFALLELARDVAATSTALRGVMTALGAGGVLGAILAAWLYRTPRYHRLLAWTFRSCGCAALLPLGAQSFPAMIAASAAVGLALGAQTVVLTSGLRAVAGAARLGLCLGTGTGTAYALCNIPWLFQASPVVQTAAAAAVMLGASLLPRAMDFLPREVLTGEPAPAGDVVRWTTVLLALVWMDSAAFYIIQHAEALRADTWGTVPALLGNAGVHLVAAVAAGALLDRGGRTLVSALGAGALVMACLTLNGAILVLLPAAWMYTAGVSLYSTVLVEFPARVGRPWSAALVFAVAGWLGSALGIGMAQDLNRIPLAFVGAAAGVITVALLWRGRRTARWVAAGAAALVLETPVDAADASSLEARGREVYIAEGCIHCHSQYVRPGVPADVQAWGPADPLEKALSGAPPLLGARRLGPDLSHVGNRRSAEWNRLHLIAPREISPGSRMPSYAHLFAGAEPRGDALVAYLASLGAETLSARQAQIAAWTPSPGLVSSPERSRHLFAQLCLPCHGAAGRGDGPVAGRLSLRPPDWSVAAWRHVPPGEKAEEGLARIIKFGLPGLPMAGHEYLPDADVVGLARHVRALHQVRGGGSSVADQQ